MCGSELAQSRSVKRLRHLKLIVTIVVILVIVAALLALAQDQVTLKIQSAHAAIAPRFPATPPPCSARMRPAATATRC